MAVQPELKSVTRFRVRGSQAGQGEAGSGGKATRQRKPFREKLPISAPMQRSVTYIVLTIRYLPLLQFSHLRLYDSRGIARRQIYPTSRPTALPSPLVGHLSGDVPALVSPPAPPRSL